MDETLRPLLEAEEKAFEGLYQQADIRLLYVSESEAAELLLRDSVRLAVLCRNLRSGEEEWIRRMKVYPTATKIASDAIALIVHPENPDTLMSYEQLQAILQGKLTQWQEPDSTGNMVGGDIQLVFDHERSSTLRYLRDSVGWTDFPPNFYALEENSKVLEYVAQSRQAIGAVGLSWISDSDDPAVQFSRKKVKVVAMPGPQQQEFFQPYQAHLAEGVYPFSRGVYVLSREARAGLGSGFTAFIANEKGQRIILKSGLLPATMPTRLVHLTVE